MNHNVEQIRKLNDDFRTTLTGGMFIMTTGIQELEPVFRTAALIKLTEFSDFTPDNDPHGEHDFGAFDVNGEKLFWKIDYYDRAMKYHSPDPANAFVTKRVLTLMLASEY
nr:DUF3768 domain-containing protein [Methylobacterium sp. L1A1]